MNTNIKKNNMAMVFIDKIKFFTICQLIHMIKIIKKSTNIAKIKTNL